jgi:hypothetical protein
MAKWNRCSRILLGDFARSAAALFFSLSLCDATPIVNVIIVFAVEDGEQMTFVGLPFFRDDGDFERSTTIRPKRSMRDATNRRNPSNTIVRQNSNQSANKNPHRAMAISLFVLTTET